MINSYMQLNLSQPAALQASAGTGKTYSLVRLVILYLLQKEQAPKLKELLLVTFTNKATAELKGRLRELLRSLTNDHSALELFLQEHESHLITQGYDTANPQHIQHIQARLDAAYIQLDEAAVHTIHGFCQYVLRTFPFESKQNFRFQLSDDQELLTEMLYDFFRQFQTTGLPEQLHLGYRCYTKKIKTWGKDPFHQLIVGENQSANSFANRHDETNLINMLKNDLRYTEISPSSAESQRVWQLYTQFNQGDGIIFKALSLLRAPISDHDGTKHRSLGQTLTELPANSDLMQLLELLAALKIKKSSCSNTAVPEPTAPFDQRLGFFLTTLKEHNLYDPTYHKECKYHFNYFFAAMKAHFLREVFAYVQSHLSYTRQVQGRMRFDDLIDDLHNLLQEDQHSSKLIQAVRKHFRVALIDEFQDTDSKQWDIFYKFFQPQAQEALYHSYLLIGDPKQSIYRFRGANLPTYYQAMATIAPDNICILTTNYRSNALVLTAINQLFSPMFTPEYCQIHPYQVLNAGNHQTPILTKNNKALGGVTFIGLTDSEQILSNKNSINKNLHQLTLKSVLSLLTDPSYRLSAPDLSQSQPIAPNHIACLVEKNDEAKVLQAILTQHNIPTVIFSDAKITESQEFTLIELLLKALIARHDQEESLMQLFQSFYLRSFLYAHDHSFTAFIHHIHQAKAILYQHGALVALEFMLNDLSITPSQLARNNANRYFINIRHLQEILLLISLQTGKFAVDNILAAMDELTASTEHSNMLSLRLERDNPSVQILTGHKAKGLEFPIVISQIAAHTPSEVYQTKALDYQSEEQAGLTHLTFYPTTDDIAIKKQQEKQEKIRLFYVALTRAQSHLFIPLLITQKENYLQNFMMQSFGVQPTNLEPAQQKDKKTPPNASMRHQQLIQALDQLMNQQAAIKQHLYDAEDLYQLPSYHDNYEIKELEQTLMKPPIVNWVNLFDRNDENSSYSALAKRLNKNLNGIEEPDQQDQDPEQTDQITALTVKGGAALGSLLHKLLEIIDFSQAQQSREAFIADPIITQLCITQAQSFLNNGWIEKNTNISALKELLWHSLNKPLYPLNIQLKDLAKHQRRHELAFRLYLQKPLTISLESQKFTLNQGYLIGFIDLLFEFEGKLYILDWKSSMLGSSQSAYDPDQLEKTMRDQHFTLQYHFYLLAAYHYAKLTDPSFTYANMGGVFYLFNRGMTLPGMKTGIYFTHPSQQEFDNFTQQFASSLTFPS